MDLIRRGACGQPRPLKTVSTDYLAKRFGLDKSGLSSRLCWIRSWRVVNREARGGREENKGVGARVNEKSKGEEGVRGPARLGISRFTASQRAGEHSQNAKGITRFEERGTRPGMSRYPRRAGRTEDGRPTALFLYDPNTGSKRVLQARKRHAFQAERVN